MTDADTDAPALLVDGLRFRWREDLAPVLDIQALRIAAGERVFLAGPSGSGKSTLLSLVAGVMLPSSGSLEVLGQSMASLSGPGRDRFRADYLGVIFQQFNLLPWLPVLDNVLLPCRFSRRRRARAVEMDGSMQAQALRLLGRLGLDAQTLLQRPVNELSVGQQQRVAAARALIGAPQLVIADEPTSALDTDLRQEFVDLLSEQCQSTGAALLFVSHDLALAPLFQRQLSLPALNRPGQEVA